MKVDYVSDLHIGFYIGSNYSNHNKVAKMIETFVLDSLPEEKGDILIIAGDVCEYNAITLQTLEEYAKYYEKVFFVFGNHDLYIMSPSQLQKYDLKSDNKKDELKQMVKESAQAERITILDNDIVQYNGVKIAGSMLWYTHPLLFDRMWWEANSNDSRKIYPTGSKPSEERHQIDLNFYKSLEDENIDLLITHIPPRHLNRRMKPNASYENVAIAAMGLHTKHWVCGHQHTRTVQEIEGTSIYLNAYGYPNELIEEPQLRSFII